MGASLELGAAGSSLAEAARHPGSAVGGKRARSPLSGSGLGDSRWNSLWDGNPVLREQSEEVFQHGAGWGGDLSGVEMLESPPRLGTFTSIHVLIFRPVIFF